MAHATLQQRFAQAIQWSTGWHVLAIATGLFLSTLTQQPLPSPSIVEVDLLEDLPIPKGTSDDVGLGTYKIEPEQPPVQPETPPQQAATPPVTPPIETPPVQETPPQPTHSVETPPNTMAEPVKQPIKTPEKKPTNTAATKTPPANTGTPATAAAKPSTASQNSLLNTIGAIKPITRQGNPGETNSEGWKLGNSTAPIKEVPIGAVLNQYRAQAKARIQGRWAAPAAIKALPPKVRPSATVHIQVSTSGAITSSSWVKKSGDSLLDESVMRAVRSAAAPPIPEVIRAKVLAEGLTLTFKP